MTSKSNSFFQCQIAQLAKLAAFCALLIPCMYFYANASTYSFVDVPSDYWAASSIENMAWRGIVNGMGDNSFAPEKTVTYAEFIAMLTREFYLDRVGPQRIPWYDTYMTAASNANILQKTKAEAFPEAPISRYETAQLIYNVMLDQGKALPSHGKTDFCIQDWNNIPACYQDAVATCYNLEIVIGTNDSGSFNGEAIMTRAEAATLMERIIGTIVHEPFTSTTQNRRATIMQCLEQKEYEYTPPHDLPIDNVIWKLVENMMDDLLVYDPTRSFQITAYEIVSVGQVKWNQNENYWSTWPEIKIAWTGMYSIEGFQPADQEMVSLDDTEGYFGRVKITKEGETYKLTFWESIY